MKKLPIHSAQFDCLINDFKDFAKIKGYSPRLKEPYFPEHIREFLFFLETRGIAEINCVTTQDILSYHEYIKQRPNQRKEGGLSQSMIQHHLFAISLFFDYLLETGLISSTPGMPSKFAPKKPVEREPLSVSEITLIYKACQTKRDKAILACAYGCGLRRNEIQQLNASDLFLSRGILNVRDGKGGKPRTVPLSDSVISDLREYLVYERPAYQTKGSIPALFINNKGTRMLGESLNLRVKYLIAQTQNQQLIQKEASLHTLRHSIATHLLDNGAQIEFVKSFLGHTDIDTSHLYAKRRKTMSLLIQKLI